MVFQWHDPQWLTFLYFVLGGFFVFWWWQNRKLNSLRVVFGKSSEYLIASVSSSKRTWHLLLQSLALAFFAVALARPLLGTKQTEVKQSGIELVLAIDVSSSMLAEDDKPSRLSLAKKKASEIVERMTGSRMGLIAFAGSAHLISPMTADPSALQLYIDSLSPDSVSTQGTSFKAVVDASVEAFDRGGVEGMDGTKPTRALVIISDGEDNEPGADPTLKKAVSQGVRVFTLGMGTARGAPIPLRDDRGVLKGYKKDKAGQPILSVPKEQVLARVAQSGGGSYNHVVYTGEDVDAIVKDLDRLEKADFKSKMSTEYDEKFQIPLALGLFFAFLDLLFGDRRRPKLGWRGRFEAAT